MYWTIFLECVIYGFGKLFHIPNGLKIAEYYEVISSNFWNLVLTATQQTYKRLPTESYLCQKKILESYQT